MMWTELEPKEKSGRTHLISFTLLQLGLLCTSWAQVMIQLSPNERCLWATALTESHGSLRILYSALKCIGLCINNPSLITYWVTLSCSVVGPWLVLRCAVAGPQQDSALFLGGCGVHHWTDGGSGGTASEVTVITPLQLPLLYNTVYSSQLPLLELNIWRMLFLQRPLLSVLCFTCDSGIVDSLRFSVVSVTTDCVYPQTPHFSLQRF